MCALQYKENIIVYRKKDRHAYLYTICTYRYLDDRHAHK